ncbi:hypothetical protein HH310_12620 [Actinoplanes sp. TBRC 11911]|uniref:hypothetical protein n=1 Tax=Actinoplanes sp. TBRC 11911 TaxID=2729386 RepID=UPI00145D9E13|nr:hypothetical protein [Actinoplanes sp. TBRC 11911]NMO52037.1 hypothetical protein [Actinoplanes sp. TBRC 11911]
MTQPPNGGVIITLADIYGQLVALTQRVDTSLARQDRADQIIAEHEADLRPLASAAQQLLDHESRIRTIEKSRWPITSVTVLLAIASLAVAVAVALTR